MACHRDGEKHQHDQRNAENAAFDEGGDGRISPINDHAADRRLHDAENDGAEAKGGDDRIDADITNQQSIDETAGAGECDSDQKGRNRADLRLQRQRQDRAAGDGCRHRQVGEPAGDEDEGHADDHDADNGHGCQDIDEIACREEDRA